MPEEKVFQQQAVHSPLEQQKQKQKQGGGGPIPCQNCRKPCKGEALRVQNKHFHIKCFVCKVCGSELAQGGFFVRQGEYICTLDYQRLYGTRCFSCQDFIEGEVVSALGKTYHPRCFVCASCKQPFPAGDRVTFNGKECICQKCTQPLPANSPAPIQAVHNCCGCGKEFKNEQSLVALDKHWHLGCFKCKVCNKVLNAEYISKDGIPYCEMDYHAMFGIQCESCKKYITGKVLEAGEKHYHPTCARCARCEQMFAEGEEMYLQGSSIWHPPCRQAAKQEEKSKVTRTSSESITSVPASSASGSPSRVIYAKLGEEMLDYKDLAALPKTKAIYNIDRPDMLSYSPYVSYPSEERHYGESPQLLSPTPTEGDGEKSPRQRRPSSPSSNSSLGGYGRYTPSRSPQNYSRQGFKQDPLPDPKPRTSLHLSLPPPNGSESGRSTPSLSTYSDGKSPSSASTYVAAPRHFHIPASRTSWQDGDDSKRTSWMILKSEIDGQMGPEDMDPRKSTCSLPTDTSQPNFPYNKSASLPGYGRNGIYKAAEMVEDEVDPDSQSWGGMRGEMEHKLELLIFSSYLTL
ncbi:actin-binding LIM protein 2 isoform X4 [Acanthochromis polyacanthus]|uniref:actin-binding LIM protein 2 isoform X4 n=1 Tax=Acanthochromis polyacanthus TaxID=80966 RepID=UPI0022343E7E|nr:actin-binding LIM protein 2 isoform X4 [Acanthochromis polyacanthus]